MPPKKVTSAPKKVAPAVPHTSYRDMIKDAIISLKERNGSSRQAIKKYVQSNNKINVTSQSVFDSQFNKAIKAGVEKNEFTQPKGPSGPLKLAKKEAPVKAAPKPTVKPAPKAPAKPTKTTGPKKADSKKADSKKADPKKADPKKTGPKKTDSKKTDPKKTVTKTTKTTAPKKAAGKKAAATKPKANSGKARKTSTAAPAVVEQPKILGKTKSGRITKTTAPQPTTTRAAPKKRTTKK